MSLSFQHSLSVQSRASPAQCSKLCNLAAAAASNLFDKVCICRSDIDTQAEPAPSARSRAGLSAVTQQALAGTRAYQGYPKSSPSSKAINVSAVSPPHSTRHSGKQWMSSTDDTDRQSAVRQQRGGLDSIFARMSPGAGDLSSDRIDDDDDEEGDGNLLGDQEDSLYGSHYNRKQGKR